MKDMIFKNIFIPFYHYLFKKSEKIDYYRKLSRRDLLSCEDLYFIQWKKLKKLINYCYSEIPYYQKLFKNLDIHPNDIKNLKDFKEIPEFDKSAIIENKYNLINPGLSEKRLIVDYAGDSTGIPAKIYRTYSEQEYIYALKARSNSWCGWNYRDKTYLMVMDQRFIKQTDSIKGRFAFINRKNMANTKNICPESMYSWVKQIRRFKPEYLYGYSSLLEEFSAFLTDEHITLEGIKGIFPTAEPLLQRELISRAFKVPVYYEYGCSGIPCIAHECSKGGLHINMDEHLVEFSEAGTNFEERRIVCTPLYTYGMPLLRYNTGDIAVFEEDPGTCECGLPYPQIKLKASRSCDNLMSNNGKLVSGIAITSYISAITSGIQQFQIVQKDLFSITVKISAHESSVEENEKNIRKLFYELMDTNLLKINFEYHESIPPSINGHFRPVISNIANNINYKENLRTKSINAYH